MMKRFNQQAAKSVKGTLTWLLMAGVTGLPTTVWAADYHVGPEQGQLAELDLVPWLDLVAGDTVNIHYRVEPYRTKIGLRAQGTAEQPVVIRGVLGPNGERPVLNGENATTPASLNDFFVTWNDGSGGTDTDEDLAIIYIKRAPSDDFNNYKPKHITIENLEIRGAYEHYTFTDHTGAVVPYADGAAPIWATSVDNLIVRNCELTDSGNGIFILSKGGGVNQVSHDVVIEKNYVHGNGSTGARYDRHHNIYTQALGITFQYNHLGRLRPGAGGSVLKDRSSGSVIRHNYIETAARVLDMIDPEESHDYLVPRESVLGRALNAEEEARLERFRNTHVYGNIFVNDLTDDTTASTSNMFHYGGDTGVLDIYRKGTLHFYNNTVYIKTTVALAYYMRLFDLSTNEENVSVKNNIVFMDGDSTLAISNWKGNIRFDSTNWINAGWINVKTDNSDSGTVTVADGVSLIEWVSGDPLCFTDYTTLDFSLLPDSACVDAGTSSLSGVVLDSMYLDYLGEQPRYLAGGVVDLGAYEDHSSIPINVPSPVKNIQIQLR